MKSRFPLDRISLVVLLAALLCPPAFAQYGGGGMNPPGGGTGGVYKAPKGGYSSSTGIAVGAAVAAGVGIAYLALHKTSMVGCVEQSADGLELANDKNKVTYKLESGGQDLVAGHRVHVSGKKLKGVGSQAFQVKGFKDLGPCSATHAGASGR